MAGLLKSNRINTYMKMNAETYSPIQIYKDYTKNLQNNKLLELS